MLIAVDALANAWHFNLEAPKESLPAQSLQRKPGLRATVCVS